MVKIMAYQKSDHNMYLIRENDRLQYEAIMEKKRQDEIAIKIKEKEEKLNRAEKERAAKMEA